MLYKTLNNGVKMSMLGFGVFQVTDPEECRKDRKSTRLNSSHRT